MKKSRNPAAAVLAVLLAGCVFAFYATRDSSQPAPAKSAAAAHPLVENSLLPDALAAAPLAATPDEQAQAREAWRLADHELDLTFASALRAAEADAAIPKTGPLRQLSDRIDRLKTVVDADKKRVEGLGTDESDALDRAKAQLDLDQDELDDAQEDLAREGGDQHARLQRLLQEHEDSDKAADQSLKFAAPPPTGTFAEQIRAWLDLGAYDGRLQAAAARAAAHAQTLLQEHNALEQKLGAQPDAAAPIAQLRKLSNQRKTLTGLDQRIQDSKQVATVYARWSGLVESRRRSVLHLGLRSVAAILAILLAAVLLSGLARRTFSGVDRRRAHQFRVIARITIQVLALLLILLVIAGPPTQLSTMIGLITAGLTVVMKDFIVAFFGWFTLMGKNGISVGDWVEIEGVSGEVVEIGVLKTVLLELGNWTDKGHPTGRRVSFSNSFALERHYFNFSTTGQWLWDELSVSVPASDDPYQLADQIREIVDRETREDAAEAAKDWERVTHQYGGTRAFSAKPAVNLRPSANGLEVLVRYITRAPQRNAVKARLFQEIVELRRAKA